jgi:hypothetical protein
MPESSEQFYRKIQPLVKRDILHINHKASNMSQYRGSPTSVHSHDGISTPRVLYTDLQGVDSFLASNTVTLSSVQVKALHTTPIVLIAPPSTRSFIFVDGVAGRLTYQGTAYTGTNNLEFRYTNGAGLKVCADIPATLFLNSTSSAYSYSPWQVDYNRNVDSNFTPVGGGSGFNGQVVVSVPTANPATGNSSVTLTIYYRVISFAT